MRDSTQAVGGGPGAHSRRALATPDADPGAATAPAARRYRRTRPIIEAKLQPVAAPPGAIARSRITDQLLDRSAPPIATLVAPAGYGKTTVLGQWAALERRPVAWLSIDEADNDPSRLVAYLAAALHRVGIVGDEALAGTISRERTLSHAVPRLLSELHDAAGPAVLVLDDAHRLTDPGCLDVLRTVLDYAPRTLHVALAGRTAPGIAVARLRAERRLLEIEARELALDAREVGALTRSTGWTLSDGEVETLLVRTEGWPTGIYLAAHAHSHGSSEAWVTRVSGADDAIAAYLHAELIHGLDDEDVALLTRTAVLDSVAVPAIEPVAGVPDGAARLLRLAEENLFIQRVGEGEPVFRYHKLLRDLLLAELARREPGATADYHRAASAWYRDSDNIELAIQHALAARDRTMAARLAADGGVAMFQSGHVGTLDRWLHALRPEDFAAVPQLALVATWVHMLTGRGDDALRLQELAERASPPEDAAERDAFEARRAMARALVCGRGPRDMLANAQLAVDREPVASRWRTHALWLRGSARFLLGDMEAAEADMLASTSEANTLDSPNLAPLGTLAVISMRRGAWTAAEGWASEAVARVDRFGYAHLLSALLPFAVEARVAAHAGRHDQAREALVRAQLVRPLAGRVAPWFSVMALLELCRAYLAISDPAGAQIVLREAEQLVRWTPGLGILTDELIEARRQLSGAAAVLVGSSALTSAELRILPFLPTYLSFPEIAERLGVSRNTVKTQAMSIYGKLWASSRGEAVERAVELGLLEPYPVPQSPVNRAPRPLPELDLQ